jgi:hypothetical protein
MSGYCFGLAFLPLRGSCPALTDIVRAVQLDQDSMFKNYFHHVQIVKVIFFSPVHEYRACVLDYAI